MTAVAASGISSAETQLGITLAAVAFGAVLAGLGWALRRIIIRELDHLAEQVDRLSQELRAWRDASDRRVTAVEARFNLLEVTSPRVVLGRRRDDPPDELHDYDEPRGGRHERTA